MMYVLLDKMLPSEKQKILEQATHYLENMNEL
jgi:hypothetical protein